jgi:hypothetical protein
MKIYKKNGDIWELSIQEYKELSGTAGNGKMDIPTSSDKVVEVCPPMPETALDIIEKIESETPLNIFKKKVKSMAEVGRKRKISLDTIKTIKRLASEGMRSTQIGKQMGLSEQSVEYWRKNTPKELKDE